MKAIPAIKTDKLTKAYGAKTAVDHLDLTINEGELFALLGVNGAGKTTTIRMLSCLSSPTSGDASVFGHSVLTEPEAVKGLIGLSPQDTAVAGNLTVRENLAFMADICGKKGSSVDDIIKAFGLEEVEKSRAKTLSGGWQRKLSIAMAVIGEPKVLFLDEPTLGLDVLARRQLWKIIDNLRKTSTIILTTHYMEEAEALSDRIGILIGGKLAGLGTLAQLEEITGKKGLEEVFISFAEQGAPTED